MVSKPIQIRLRKRSKALKGRPSSLLKGRAARAKIRSFINHKEPFAQLASKEAINGHVEKRQTRISKSKAMLDKGIATIFDKMKINGN